MLPLFALASIDIWYFLQLIWYYIKRSVIFGALGRTFWTSETAHWSVKRHHRRFCECLAAAAAEYCRDR